MSRVRFHFDPVTHRYLPVHRSLRSRLLGAALMCFAALILAFFLRIFTERYFTRPKENRLQAEKEKILDQYPAIEQRVDELERSILEFQKRDDHIYRTFYELDPIPQSLRKAGLGGSQKYRMLEGFESSALMIGLSQRADLAEIRLDLQRRSFDDLISKAEQHARLMRQKPSIQPISLKDFYWISSVYGYRTDPMSHRRTMHKGVDFAGRIGLNVYATGDGVVKSIRMSSHGYGKQVVIDHGYGYTSRYGHLNSILVHTGQKVFRGTVIGVLGNTGKSTGPHLHYEVRRYNRALNPKHFYAEDLTPEEYTKIVTKTVPAGY